MDLLAVQGTFKNLQYHSLKASILQRSAFFTVQLSHPYMTTGKTIALTRRTFVGKIIVTGMFKRHFEGALLTDEFICSKYKLETHKLVFFSSP